MNALQNILSNPRNRLVELREEEGILILKAPSALRERIGFLTDKEKGLGLSEEETRELDGYLEMDDLLSHMNRVIRNSALLGESPLAP